MLKNGCQDDRMDVLMTGLLNDRMTGWQDYRLTGWQNDRKTEWQEDRMTGRQNDRMMRWRDDRMTNDKWPNDLITRWHGWWGWLDDRELRRRLTIWYILHIISTWAWMWDDLRLVHDSTRKCDIPQQFTGVLDDPRILKIKAHLKSPFRKRQCDSDNELLD